MDSVQTKEKSKEIQDQSEEIQDQSEENHLIEMFQCTRDQYDRRDELEPKALNSNS